MPRPNQAQSALLPTSPLLSTESAEDFDRIRDAFVQQIKPRLIIDHMYALDIAELTLELLRIRRCKAGILNLALVSARIDVFHDALQKAGYDYVQASKLAENIGRRWSINQAVRKWGKKVLRQFQLDESAIEGEAYKKSAEALELLDKLEASKESRRNKALRCIAEYRSDLARHLEQASDRIIEGEVLALEDTFTTTPSEAA
jgi:hypothetical protein